MDKTSLSIACLWELNAKRPQKTGHLGGWPQAFLWPVSEGAMPARDSPERVLQVCDFEGEALGWCCNKWEIGTAGQHLG